MDHFGLAYLALIFVAGMLGSFHCVGMCGGFACALGASRGGPLATLGRHLLYNAARATSYVFLGALAGHAGAGVAALEFGSGELWQRLLAVAAGLAMVLMAVQLLARGPRGSVLAPAFVATTRVGSLQALLRSGGAGAPLALGVFNGFLPCPLVYAFLALALASGDAAAGALLMFAFGLGTFPAMLLTGTLGTWLRHAWRRDGVRFAGLLVLLLGIITVARGVLPLSGHGAHLSLPAFNAPPAATMDDRHQHHRRGIEL